MLCVAVWVVCIVESFIDDHAADSMLHRLESQAGVLSDSDRLQQRSPERGLMESNSVDIAEPIPTIVCQAAPSKHEGLLQGKVRDAATRKGLANVELRFSHSRGTCLAATDSTGHFKIALEVWSGAHIHKSRRKVTFSKDGFSETVAYFHVFRNTARVVETLDLVPVQQSDVELGSAVGGLNFHVAKTKGRLSGTLLSSSTGKSITTDCCTQCEAVKLHLRHGAHNHFAGRRIRAFVRAGKFHANSLTPGTYTLQITAPCYVPQFHTVAVLGGRHNKYNKQLILAPRLDSSEKDDSRLRFVLTWEKEPRNLNLHLLTPPTTNKKNQKTWSEVTAAQTSNHIANFKERIYNGHGYKIISNGKGSLHKPPFSKLMLDSQNGFGPEELVVTATIPGVYTLYAQRVGGQGTSLELSGAKVAVYQNNKQVETVNIPSNGNSLTKDFWSVLTFKGGDQTSVLGGAAFQAQVMNEIVRREPPQGAYV